MSDLDERIRRTGLPDPNASWFHPPVRTGVCNTLSMHFVMGVIVVMSMIAWVAWAISER